MIPFKLGLVGKGKFGSKIYSKLENIPTAKVDHINGRQYRTEQNYDWIFIATPTSSHFDIAEYFLKKGSNVFLEKPGGNCSKEVYSLINTSNKYKKYLYIDDVFLYNPIVKSIQGKDIKKFNWLKYGSFDESLFNSLSYHDIYLSLFLNQIKDNDPVNVSLNQNNIKNFVINDIEFSYNRLSKHSEKTVETFSDRYSFETETDPLKEMIISVLHEKVDYSFNNNLALRTQKFVDVLNQNRPKIAIVGGGIFGTTSALNLSNNNYEIDLFEKENNILQCASGINQYRLHKGYHYPRSKETAISSKKGTQSFINRFPCVENTKQYYSVAKKNSKISSEEFEVFMNELKLNYTPVTDIKLINNSKIESTYLVEEELYNPNLLRKLIEDEINTSDINLNLNTSFTEDLISKYDYVINASYSKLNELRTSKKNLQFELCEKPVVRLPEKFKGSGFVIIDGPFTCIDPFLNDYHVVGNVVHAIHDSYIGIEYTPPTEFNDLLNKGIVENPHITNIEYFKEDLKKFFKNIEPIEHVGSMYTIRTVLPNRDHDDARPSIVAKEDLKNYSIFSGKISTAVHVSEELKQLLKYT